VFGHFLADGSGVMSSGDRVVGVDQEDGAARKAGGVGAKCVDFTFKL
jgi:hypothetical protein